MRKITLFLTTLLFSIGAKSLHAQVLSVASGTDFNIVSGTVIGADSLDLTPSSNFTLNGVSMTHATTASAATSFPYIGSVYQFSNTTNPFSGTVQFNYDAATLNSIPTNYLSLHIYNGSDWNSNTVASLNTTTKSLQTTGLSGISLNQLTLATPPTWVGTGSPLWTTPINWVANYVPISTSNVVIQPGTHNDPVIANSVALKNLTINNGASVVVTDTLAITGTINNNGTFKVSSGTLVLNGTSAQTIGSTTINNDSIHNLVINNAAGVSLAAPLFLTGTLTPTAGTLSTGGNLTLVSTVAGTARIAQGSGNYITGNVNVQRFITAKSGRKYSYISSAVTQTIRNAWQQQIYITGTGTGGKTCGTTTGDGGSTDKYNSNGFDVTNTNKPSMFIYNAAKINGSRYVSVPNTDYTNLVPGTGYIMNIRGNRNSSTYDCNNQLNANAYGAPEAVTLNATGTVTTGSLSVSLYDTAVSKFTLIGNPYPSQICFSTFQAGNSATIYNKMWTYSPFGNGNYTTCMQGIATNCAMGFDNTNCDYIASGQAFFVQATQAGSSGTVTFQENNKVGITMPNTQYFGNAVNRLIRVGLKTVDSSALLDEVVVRFNANGSKQYDANWDASSLSSASQTLTVLKGNSKIAIATLPGNLAEDTASLGVSSTANGQFRLAFSEYQGIDAAQSITLVDKFLGTTQDVRAKQVYDFTVTADTASQGNNRFKLVFGAANTLPVNFTAISATKTGADVTIKWNTANETNIASYEVERSTNGTAFNTINSKKAAGANNYAVADASLPANASTLYYRIKAIGTDGTTKYSSIAKLTTNNSPLTTIAIYPNPVNRDLNVTLSNAATGVYTVRIATVTGNPVYGKSGMTITGGKLNLDAGSFAAGVYVLELTDAKGNKYQEKFIKE